MHFRIIHLIITAALFIPCSSLAETAMVVSEQKLASQVGIDILRKGGNAIDAAVAMGYALAVVNPCCGNIGGGGFMTIRLANGKTSVINFREKAPLRATRNMFMNKQGLAAEKSDLSTYLWVAVPGTVLGLETARTHYGTMTRKQVMAPAIKLADKGFIITPSQAKQFSLFANDFRQQPNVAAIFMHHNKTLPTGYRLIQKELAHTLQLISTQGSKAFYHGEIAKAIVAASNQHGGILSLNDFAHYHVEILKPITCNYHGYTIISTPPPSSGGVSMCEMLNILDNLSLTSVNSAADVQKIVEAMRYGFIDRDTKLGDPNFVHNPTEQLISTSYAKNISIKIQHSQSAPKTNATTEHKELTDTTHFSIVDSKGNAVSVTYTLNGFFGSRLIAGNTGFFLNNEMDDFATVPGQPNKFGLVQYEANTIAAGKRPLSSMAPTIITKNNHLYMVLGSPGGPRIISSLLLTILNSLNYKMNLSQAVNAPRFHYQAIPDSIDLEPQALPAATIGQLETWGYHVLVQSTWGAVEAIKIDPVTKKLEGVNDHRRPDGAALGME